MEKMSIIFYVLTFFGALLVPTFSTGGNSSPTTGNTSISSGKDNLSMGLNVPSSITVSNENGTAEDNSSITQNVTANISSIPEPSTTDETATKSSTEKKSTTRAPPGALLVPTFSMVNISSPSNVNTSISSGPEVQSMDLATNSMTVSKENGTAEDNSSITQNLTANISSIPEPSTTGSPIGNLTTAGKTTNETKDETATKSSTEKKSTTRAPPVETTPAPDTKGKTENESSTTPVPDSSGETGKESTTKSVPGTTDKIEGSSSVSIIVILVVICVIIFCIIVFCVYKGYCRRYSVYIHAKNENAQIPLALVEPDLCDVSPKAMKTFASAEESSPTGTGEKTEQEKGSETVTQSPREKNEDYENYQNITPMKGRENVTSSESVYQSLNPATNQLDSVYHTLTVTTDGTQAVF